MPQSSARPLLPATEGKAACLSLVDKAHKHKGRREREGGRGGVNKAKTSANKNKRKRQEVRTACPPPPASSLAPPPPGRPRDTAGAPARGEPTVNHPRLAFSSSHQSNQVMQRAPALLAALALVCAAAGQYVVSEVGVTIKRAWRDDGVGCAGCGVGGVF